MSLVVSVMAMLVTLVAVLGLILAHFFSWADPMYTYSAILIAIAAGIAVANIYPNAFAVLTTTGVLAIFLVAAEQFNWLGLRGVV